MLSGKYIYQISQQNTIIMGVIMSDYSYIHIIANDLCAVCDSIVEVTDWFTLGLTLNLPSHRLEWIQRERGFNEKERQRNMISLWLNNGDASWRALVQGLTNQQVNKCQVAKRISEQHQLKK